jgi:exonuclease VII small subunit
MWKEVLEKKGDAIGSQPTPTMAMYTEAMDKFTKSATAFMQHVHLLNEARDAYQEAVSASSAMRRSLDAGDQVLRSLMSQLEQVVAAHFGDPALDRKKLELVKAEANRTNSGSTGSGVRTLP